MLTGHVDMGSTSDPLSEDPQEAKGPESSCPSSSGGSSAANPAPAALPVGTSEEEPCQVWAAGAAWYTSALLLEAPAPPWHLRAAL